MNLNNKIVVITGGSKGLGKGLAQAFAKNGSTVVITSTSDFELQDISEELSIEGYVVDASSADETDSFAKKITDKYGKIDIWLNNAGVQIAPSNIEDVPIEKLHQLFDVNYFGYFYGIQSALKVMKPTDSGLIININSTAGLDGKPGLSAYASSKFAIKGLSESVREEIEDTNIKLYQVFPGGIQTDIYHEKVPDDIGEYMNVEYAVDKIMTNLKSTFPEQDLVIR